MGHQGDQLHHVLLIASTQIHMYGAYTYTDVLS